MHIICNLLLNTFMKESEYLFSKYLIANRFIKNTSLIFAESNLKHNIKSKSKITIVKRKFLGNSKISVIEWKTAESVIKRLNWENKYLYGPVLTSKTNDLEAAVESNIIQHETRIPIIEPPGDYKSDVNRSIEEQKCDLNSILTFPLINRCVHSACKINEVNYLRRHLKFLCKNSSVPSVTLILQKTMPKERVEILNKWKQNMIRELGEEGFEKYQKETLENGVSLHHTISSFLSSMPESELHLKEENVGHWKSLKYVFPNIRDVKLLEEFVEHPFLCYRGVVDCFAKYKDHLVVIDWKTSKKSKAKIKNTYDDPLQIAAYVGALNFDPKFQYLASKGLIAIAYENGMPATVHFINELCLKHYWDEWLKRVKQYWEMMNSELET